MPLIGYTFCVSCAIGVPQEALTEEEVEGPAVVQAASPTPTWPSRVIVKSNHQIEPSPHRKFLSRL